MIEKIIWNGVIAVRLAAGGYEAVLVPGTGANLVSLHHTESGTQILRTPSEEQMAEFASRPQIYGLPLLFPPNRIEDGQYTYAGRTYRFPITIAAQNNFHHGTIKSEPFTVSRCEEGDGWAYVEAVYYSNRVNDGVWSYFPHDFECRMGFHLSAEGLEHTVVFKNLGSEPMPVGVGYHTPLKAPFTKDGDGSQYRLRLSVGKKWELTPERTLPTGRLLELNEMEAALRSKEGLCPLGTPIEIAFTDEPITVDGEPYSGAVLTDTATGRSVYYRVDSKMKHWTLWNNGGAAGYVCPEPQSWAINAPNLALPAEVTGMAAIAPGEEWMSTARIYTK